MLTASLHSPFSFSHCLLAFNCPCLAGSRLFTFQCASNRGRSRGLPVTAVRRGTKRSPPAGRFKPTAAVKHRPSRRGCAGAIVQVQVSSLLARVALAAAAAAAAARLRSSSFLSLPPTASYSSPLPTLLACDVRCANGAASPRPTVSPCRVSVAVRFLRSRSLLRVASSLCQYTRAAFGVVSRRSPPWWMSTGGRRVSPMRGARWMWFAAAAARKGGTGLEISPRRHRFLPVLGAHVHEKFQDLVFENSCTGVPFPPLFGEIFLADVSMISCY